MKSIKKHNKTLQPIANAPAEFKRSQPARSIRRTGCSINKGISLITQTRIRSKTRRLRTAELIGGVLNEVCSMNYLRYPNENKTLERNINYCGPSIATLNQNRNNLYTAQLGRYVTKER